MDYHFLPYLTLRDILFTEPRELAPFVNESDWISTFPEEIRGLSGWGQYFLEGEGLPEDLRCVGGLAAGRDPKACGQRQPPMCAGHPYLCPCPSPALSGRSSAHFTQPIPTHPGSGFIALVEPLDHQGDFSRTQDPLETEGTRSSGGIRYGMVFEALW